MHCAMALVGPYTITLVLCALSVSVALCVCDLVLEYLVQTLDLRSGV